MGCAFGKHGQANSGYFGVELPPIPPGMNKTEVIRTLGVPDSSVSFGGNEYWRYRNVSGWFLLFVGSTNEKDLIIEFSENKVRTSYLTEKGSSFGIFMIQGAVAN